MARPSSPLTDPGAVQELDNREMVKVLIKHFGYTEGRFRLSARFRLHVANFQLAETPQSTPMKYPGTLAIIEGLGLGSVPADEPDSPDIVDAASLKDVVGEPPSVQKRVAAKRRRA